MYRDGLRVGTVDAKVDTTTLTAGKLIKFDGVKLVGDTGGGLTQAQALVLVSYRG